MVYSPYPRNSIFSKPILGIPAQKLMDFEAQDVIHMPDKFATSREGSPSKFTFSSCTHPVFFFQLLLHLTSNLEPMSSFLQLMNPDILPILCFCVIHLNQLLYQNLLMLLYLLLTRKMENLIRTEKSDTLPNPTVREQLKTTSTSNSPCSNLVVP